MFSRNLLIPAYKARSIVSYKMIIWIAWCCIVLPKLILNGSWHPQICIKNDLEPLEKKKRQVLLTRNLGATLQHPLSILSSYMIL